MGALVLFGISFGYLEAAAVIYLHVIYGPSPQSPNRPSEPIDLTTQLASAPSASHARLKTEMFREGATLIMLAALALAAAKSTEQWLANFLIAFGAWDISYYVFLKALIGWPQSVLTWDVLFLLPVPWAAPVLAPALVALSMIVAGAVLLWREQNGQAVRLGWFRWAMMAAAALILVLSFTWDFRSVVAGQYPQAFHWLLFGLGELLGLSGLLYGLWRPGAQRWQSDWAGRGREEAACQATLETAR
jgi:hypothetical protein